MARHFRECSTLMREMWLLHSQFNVPNEKSHLANIRCVVIDIELAIRCDQRCPSTNNTNTNPMELQRTLFLSLLLSSSLLLLFVRFSICAGIALYECKIKCHVRSIIIIGIVKKISRHHMIKRNIICYRNEKARGKKCLAKETNQSEHICVGFGIHFGRQNPDKPIDFRMC